MLRRNTVGLGKQSFVRSHFTRVSRARTPGRARPGFARCRRSHGGGNITRRAPSPSASVCPQPRLHLASCTFGAMPVSAVTDPDYASVDDGCDVPSTVRVGRDLHNRPRVLVCMGRTIDRLECHDASVSPRGKWAPTVPPEFGETLMKPRSDVLLDWAFLRESKYHAVISGNPAHGWAARSSRAGTIFALQRDDGYQFDACGVLGCRADPVLWRKRVGHRLGAPVEDRQGIRQRTSGLRRMRSYFALIAMAMFPVCHPGLLT